MKNATPTSLVALSHCLYTLFCLHTTICHHSNAKQKLKIKHALKKVYEKYVYFISISLTIWSLLYFKERSS